MKLGIIGYGTCARQMVLQIQKLNLLFKIIAITDRKNKFIKKQLGESIS